MARIPGEQAIFFIALSPSLPFSPSFFPASPISPSSPFFSESLLPTTVVLLFFLPMIVLPFYLPRFLMDPLLLTLPFLLPHTPLFAFFFSDPLAAFFLMLVHNSDVDTPVFPFSFFPDLAPVLLTFFLLSIFGSFLLLHAGFSPCFCADNLLLAADLCH